MRCSHGSMMSLAPVISGRASRANWSFLWMQFSMTMETTKRQPSGCTFKSDRNLWLTSVYMKSRPIVRFSLVHKPSRMPEPSIQLLIVHVHSKGVFGLSLKLTFMMIFFLLCPSQRGFLSIVDRNRCGIDNFDLFLRSSFVFFFRQFSNTSRQAP